MLYNGAQQREADARERIAFMRKLIVVMFSVAPVVVLVMFGALRTTIRATLTEPFAQHRSH